MKQNNQKLINDYLGFYRHSKQSMAMRKSSLKYFFSKDRFSYDDHVFDITTKKLKGYFTYLKNLEDLSLNTKKAKWNIMVSFLRYTMEDYEEFLITIPSKTINWNGAHNNGEVSNKNVYATKEEIEKIMNFLRKKNLKHYIIFRILIETGIRKGELIKLQINEFDLENCVLNPHRGKTGEKYYFVSRELCKYLKILLEEREKIMTDSSELFITKNQQKYSNRSFNLILKHALDKLNIEQNITCHTFRRTINDLRKEMGCPNEDRKILLGHKGDLNVESYTNADIKRIRRLADKWNPYKTLQF